ncbi:MAG: hypothetical protein JWQ21_1255 [Herminiimonas sp.]|nr:hypothetical protein [Herminiimonas sp.]
MPIQRMAFLGRIFRKPVRCNPLSVSLRYTVEELYGPGLQRIFGTYHEEPIFLDQLLDHLRSMPQMVCRGEDVGAHGMPHQGISVMPEFCRQQAFHGRANEVDDRMQIPRLVFRRSLKFFQRRLNSPAPRVAQDDHEPCAEPFRGELDAADLRWSDDVSGNADNKQVAQALVKDDFYRHPGVGTSENGGEWLLACRQLAAMGLAREWVAAPIIRHEATVPLLQTFECFSC